MAPGRLHTLPSALTQAAREHVKSLRDFANKVNNDWVMGLASALAFNLITAILPILMAIVALVGFTVGQLDPAAEQQLIAQLQRLFPDSSTFLLIAFATLKRDAGLFTIIAIGLSLFGGSRLFVSLEGYFDLIYHTRTRSLLRQNVMALLMLLLFMALTAPMMLAASIPALLKVVLQHTLVTQLPGHGLLFGLLSILVSLLIAWVLFEAIYIVVPNQRISFRDSWLGAVVAAVLLQLYLSLFPLYIAHFLFSFTDKTAGTTGLLVILLFFFYYFAVILLLGAEINAFYAEGIRTTPDNLANMVHALTSHLSTTEKERREQATPTHRQTEPEQGRPKRGAERRETHGHAVPTRL